MSPRDLDMPHAPCNLAIALAGTAVTTVGTAVGDTITVCEEGCDFTSINAAIEAAAPGDLIQLSAEVYREGEPIRPDGKAFTLQGVPDQDGDGRPETILDGDLQHAVMECLGGELGNTRFQDLLVRNGSAPGGGGVFSVNSRALLLRCVFEGNRAEDFGGAILNSFGALHIEDCVFRNNHAGFQGGAMVDDRSSSYIVGTTFHGNSTPWRGGGLACTTGATTLVADSTFQDNHAAEGGAIHSYTSTPTLMNVVFTENMATLLGPVLRNEESLPTLQGCVLDACCPISPIDSIDDAGANDFIAWCDDCRGDLDCDGVVGAADLGVLLARWSSDSPIADLDGDGLVHGPDLGLLFVDWGTCR